MPIHPCSTVQWLVPQFATAVGTESVGQAVWAVGSIRLVADLSAIPRNPRGSSGEAVDWWELQISAVLTPCLGASTRLPASGTASWQSARRLSGAVHIRICALRGGEPAGSGGTRMAVTPKGLATASCGTLSGFSLPEVDNRAAQSR